MEPAELKYQKYISKWIEVKSTINLEWDFILQRKGKNRFSDMKVLTIYQNTFYKSILLHDTLNN